MKRGIWNQYRLLNQFLGLLNVDDWMDKREQSSTCSIVIPSTINCVIRIKLIKELESSSITGKRIKGGHFDFDDIDLFAQSTRKQSNRSVGQHIGNVHTKASQCGDPTDCYHHRKPDISFGWEAERARNFLHRREAWDNVLALEEGQFHPLPRRSDGSTRHETAEKWNIV